MKEMLEMFNTLAEKSEGFCNSVGDYIKITGAYSRYIQENYPNVHEEAIKEIENGND